MTGVSTGGSTTAGNGSGSTGGTTGSSTGSSVGAAVQALPITTFVYLKVTHSGVSETDELWGYDVATKQAALITNLPSSGTGGEVGIAGHSISPDRKSIAFAAYFRPDAADLATGLATAAIWTVAVDGTNFQRRSPTQPDSGGSGNACTIDASCGDSDYVCASALCRLRGFNIDVRDPAWAPDGSAIMFNIGDYWTKGDGTLGGGTVPWIALLAGGLPTAAIASPPCAQVSDVAYDPRGGAFLAINSVCVAGSDEGLWSYPLAGGAPTQIAGSSLDSVDVSLAPPSWTPDGAGFVFAGAAKTMIGGSTVQASDGLVYLTQGSTLGILASPPSADVYVDDITVSADGNYYAYTQRDSSDAMNIYVIDISSGSAVTTQVTSDGVSKAPRF
jgi:Tol biopolymer transport system component